MVSADEKHERRPQRHRHRGRDACGVGDLHRSDGAGASRRTWAACFAPRDDPAAIHLQPRPGGGCDRGRCWSLALRRSPLRRGQLSDDPSVARDLGVPGVRDSLDLRFPDPDADQPGGAHRLPPWSHRLGRRCRLRPPSLGSVRELHLRTRGRESNSRAFDPRARDDDHGPRRSVPLPPTSRAGRRLLEASRYPGVVRGTGLCWGPSGRKSGWRLSLDSPTCTTPRGPTTDRARSGLAGWDGAGYHRRAPARGQSTLDRSGDERRDPGDRHQRVPGAVACDPGRRTGGGSGS